jgi:hypothetical protein
LLALSTKDAVRFTPDRLKERDPVPVFLLKTPSLRDKIALDAEVQAEGVRYPPNTEYAEVLREAVLAQVLERDHPQLLEIILEYEAVNEEGNPIPAELTERIEEIAKALRPYHRPLAQLEAERTRYLGTAFLVRAEMFLLKIEGDPEAPEIERRYGKLTEDCQNAIEQRYGQGTLFAIGGRTIEITQPTEDERKNSPSPPASPPDPETSTEEPPPPTARRGRSLGNGTGATPA